MDAGSQLRHQLELSARTSTCSHSVGTEQIPLSLEAGFQREGGGDIEIELMVKLKVETDRAIQAETEKNRQIS